MTDNFGSGVIVPLVLFTEHFNDFFANRVDEAIAWNHMTPSERLPFIEAMNYGGSQMAVLILRLENEDIEDIINEYITLWAYGAGDHFLELDKKKSPASLIELAKLMTDLRFGRHEPLGEATWKRIKILWREAAMDIDEQIVGTRPRWEELPEGPE